MPRTNSAAPDERDRRGVIAASTLMAAISAAALAKILEGVPFFPLLALLGVVWSGIVVANTPPSPSASRKTG